MVHITNIQRGRRRSMGERGETIDLVHEEIGAQAVDVHVNVLRPGGPRGRYHYHPQNENIYVVLSGTGQFVAEGQEYLLEKDDVVFIPPGVRHSLSATGDAELVLLELYAPGRRESVYVD